jgi:hypothetical protein
MSEESVVETPVVPSVETPVAEVPVDKYSGMTVEHAGSEKSEKSETSTEKPIEEVKKPENTPKHDDDATTPLPKGVQKRIDRAVREKYQAEARAKALEERIAAIESRQAPQQTPQKATAVGEPKLADFSDFEEYVSAKAKYVAEQQTQQMLMGMQQRAQEEAAKAAAQRASDTWNKKVSLVTKEIPDYNEVVGEAELPLTPAMRETIMESEVGPKVAYYLATHPEETQKIAGLTPLGAVRALMRIEDGLKTKPITATPDPIRQIGSGHASGVKSLTDSMTQEEFEKRRRAFIARR